MTKLKYPIDDEKRKALREYQKEWRKKNPDKAKLIEARQRATDAWRDTQLRFKYGITLAEYNILFENQNGCCAICGSKETKRKGNKNLCVDHDHNTNRIRGLLCLNCNRALGLFGDDKEVIEKALSYLEL
jgi:hypothetical protein